MSRRREIAKAQGTNRGPADELPARAVDLQHRLLHEIFGSRKVLGLAQEVTIEAGASPSYRSPKADASPDA